MVAHAFNPSTPEAEAGRFLSSSPAWSTEWVPGQPEIYRETLSWKKNEMECLQRTLALFSESTWCFTTIHNSSFRVFNAFFYHLRALHNSGVHACMQKKNIYSHKLKTNLLKSREYLKKTPMSTGAHPLTLPHTYHIWIWNSYVLQCEADFSDYVVTVDVLILTSKILYKKSMFCEHCDIRVRHVFILV